MRRSRRYGTGDVQRRLIGRFAQAQGTGDRAGHEAGISDGRERDEDRSVGEPIDLLGQAQAQACLARLPVDRSA